MIAAAVLLLMTSSLHAAEMKQPARPVVSEGGELSTSVELMTASPNLDLSPYLTGVLQKVRQHWLEDLPRSAKNHVWRVSAQMLIARDGSISTLSVVSKSGKSGMDRFALAAISASNPFPALPARFEGDKILVQVNFGSTGGK
jgi:outer membrane biosynthesis protein TonB